MAVSVSNNRVKLAIVFLVLVEVAQACSCRPVSANEALGNADVVFRGTIAEIRNPQTEPLNTVLQHPPRRVVFRVTRVWKGVVGETFEMPAIEHTGGYCLGFWRHLLVVGNDLLVYAYRTKGTADYTTNICSHTQLASDAEKDLRELGLGTAPKKED